MGDSSGCGVVVVGGSISGLSTVQALAHHGIPVAVVLTSPRDIAHYSHWVRESHRLFEFFTQPESLLDLLERQSRRWHGWTVLTNHDEAATVLSQNRERFERWHRIVTPPWDTTCHLLHKDLTYKAAQEVGVDIPRVYGEASLATAARADITFPVVVKPVESCPFVLRFGVKLFVARDHKAHS